MELKEIIKINKNENAESCTISQLISALEKIKNKYGDIEIIHDSEYTNEISQIGILSKIENTEENIAEIAYFTDK